MLPTLHFLDGEAFPLRRIFCVGQNYRAHALEMGSDPDRQSPFFFQKPADALVLEGGRVPYPPRTSRLEYEVELVVAIATQASAIPPDQALSIIAGYAVGIDLTRRDLQADAKKAGRPWDMAKGFDHSAPCGKLARQAPASGAAIWLKLDGQTRQASELSQMIWSVPEIIAELSTYVTLRPGDLIYTGTPENVGPVLPGATLQAHIDGLAELQISITT
jgi:fumarylpyruvate hydrolase